MEKIKITYQQKEYQVDPLITPWEFFLLLSDKSMRPLAAIINGQMSQLNKKIIVNSHLDYIVLGTYQGQRVYESSLIFLFIAAIVKKFPQVEVFIQHAIPKGVYAEIKKGNLSSQDIEAVELLMIDYVRREVEIKQIIKEWDVSLSKMHETDRLDLIKLYKFYPPSEIKLYEMEGHYESFYLPLVPNTRFLIDFRLLSYQEGVAILFPDFEKKIPMDNFQHAPKLFSTYKEYSNWGKILKVRTVGQLNKYIISGEIKDYIKISEALHEKKISSIADSISHQSTPPKIILISGPSSSGKTTFAKRLSIQLRVNGLRPILISLDDYFLDREHTPQDANGDYDFETIDAIDVNLFQQNLRDLLAGQSVALPKFDFVTGERRLQGKSLQLQPENVILVEGIHGINPKLTGMIDEKMKFKIYISALTQLNLHRHDRVPTSDTRLLRRIVRDRLFRGYSASETLRRWRSVRAGESIHIFPYQETADLVFNSVLFYELSVLKNYAENLLLQVSQGEETYAEAQRLLKFLSFFLALDQQQVPNNSILKEFIGGSSFEY